MAYTAIPAATGGGGLSLAALSNPYTAALAAVPFAINGIRQIGAGRRAANRGVQGYENPFGAELAEVERLIASGDTETAKQKLQSAFNTYMSGVQSGLSAGGKDKIVAEQSLANPKLWGYADNIANSLGLTLDKSSGQVGDQGGSQGGANQNSGGGMNLRDLLSLGTAAGSQFMPGNSPSVSGRDISDIIPQGIEDLIRITTGSGAPPNTGRVGGQTGPIRVPGTEISVTDTMPNNPSTTLDRIGTVLDTIGKVSDVVDKGRTAITGKSSSSVNTGGNNSSNAESDVLDKLLQYILLGSGVLSSLYNANSLSNAAKEAAEIQAGTVREGYDLIRDMNNQAREDQMPWLKSGRTSLAMLNNLLGMPPEQAGTPEGTPFANPPAMGAPARIYNPAQPRPAGGGFRAARVMR